MSGDCPVCGGVNPENCWRCRLGAALAAELAADDTEEAA